MVDPNKVIGEERSNSSYETEHNKPTQKVTKEKEPPKSTYEQSPQLAEKVKDNQ